MPSTDARETIGAEPLTKTAADQLQSAGQAAVMVSTTDPTEQTRTVVGTLQAAAQTVPGAIGTSSATTAVSLGIGNFADLQELTPSAYAAMFLFQGVKHHRFVNQDRDKWWLLPLLAGICAFAIVFFMSHGDLWESASHCVRSMWMAAYQAMLTYHASKPMGMFSSAADLSDGGIADEPGAIRGGEQDSGPSVSA